MMDKFLRLLLDPVRWYLTLGVVIVLSTGWIWVSVVPPDATTGRIPSPKEGFPAPDFTLDLLDGGQVALGDHQGEVVVLNLWASWCRPCLAEMPALQNVFVSHKERGLTILAVNMTYQDNAASAAVFAEELGLTFPIALDRSGIVAEAYQLRALPSTFFIDREGVIQQVVIGGPMSEVTILSGVEALLEGSN